MTNLRKSLLVWTVFLISVNSLGQFSAGGFGQGQGGKGGMAGGMGGGMGGPMNSDYDDSALDKAKDNQYENLTWVSKTLILTPGDRAEFTLEGKKDETIFISATSDIFDPAIEVEDDAKKQIAYNDDREVGNQSPFIAITLPKDGNYKMYIKCARPTGGGKFTVSTYRFSAPLIAKGITFSKPDFSVPQTRNNSFPQFVRVPVEKGKFYSLKMGISQFKGRVGVAFNTVPTVFGTTGVFRNDFQTFLGPNRTEVYEALHDGELYAYINGYTRNSDVEIGSALQIPDIHKISMASPEKLSFRPSEIKLVQFPVENKQLIRTKLDLGQHFQYGLTSPGDESGRGSESDVNATFGINRYFAWFKKMKNSEDDVVRIFGNKGTATMVIINNGSLTKDLLVENTSVIGDWTSGTEAGGKLEIGESRLVKLTSSLAELMRIRSAATTFELQIDIFDESGKLLNTLLDPIKHSPRDDLYFPEAKTFYVRTSCLGHGGSGTYTLRRDPLPTKDLTLDKPEVLNITDDAQGIFTVELVAGKSYELTTIGATPPARVDLLDPKGEFLFSQNLTLDGVTLRYFTVRNSGKHRLWLRNGTGSSTVTLKSYSRK